MEGKAFLAVATDLMKFATEAHRRSAAHCAYYALMLEARDALLRWGFGPLPRDRVHPMVRLRFTYPAHPNVKAIGDALDWLVQLRNQAQYQLSFAGPFTSDQRVIRAITRARTALGILSRLDSDPTERAAAIAAIRAAGF